MYKILLTLIKYKCKKMCQRQNRVEILVFRINKNKFKETLINLNHFTQGSTLHQFPIYTNTTPIPYRSVVKFRMNVKPMQMKRYVLVLTVIITCKKKNIMQQMSKIQFYCRYFIPC